MRKRWLASFVIFLCFTAFFYINNHWIAISEYEIQSDNLPSDFSGMKVVHLSDLHDAAFGGKQKRIIQKVNKENPDFIFFTGDLIDSNRYDLTNSLHVIEGLANIAPVYCVLGNHEVASNQVNEIVQALQKRGAAVLQNEALTIERNSQEIVIGGIDDPLMRISEQQDEKTIVKSNVERTFHHLDEQKFKLLLSHRPEFFGVYADQNIDVVFSGHAHGGQIRLPFVGGLFSSGQGWLPKFTSGVYTFQLTNMVVSRGLGNSHVPFRIFNFPEIVVVTIKR